jgi:hypothetical protein
MVQFHGSGGELETSKITSTEAGTRRKAETVLTGVCKIICKILKYAKCS